MKTLILLSIFSILILQGCIQAPSNARKKSTSSSATTSTGGTTPGATFSADELLYWFTTSKIVGTVTVNKNNQDVIYLRGKYVNDFLNTTDASGVSYSSKQYCLVGSFGTDPAYRQLRIRATPVNVATTPTTIERLFRIDLPSESDNTSLCPYIIYDPSTQAYTSPPAMAFSLPKMCVPTATNKCASQITSSNLSIFSYEKSFQNQSNILVKILSNSLNLSSALLKVDLSSNATDPNSSCTDSSCAAKGFNCCISGQCVNDGTEKTNASLDIQYNQAKLDVAKNSLNFILYPNIYNICSNIAHSPAPSTGSATTPVADAQARVTQYLADYKCISSPLDSNGNSTCATYATTKTKLAISCGCTAAPADMATKCPNWGIVPVYKTGATQIDSNITDFVCYTPAPANPIGPITNLNVSVSNRSAPHRFYSATNNNYDDISTLFTKAPPTDPNPVQEGLAFSYLDEYNKFGPVNNSYNINSVLGSMTIDLSHTLPAKEVDVELGKSYILSATSGYFTPCSQCAKDSWFTSFTAHPASQRGMGLQAAGYSTARDAYAGNSTFGNYEDTQFGRACYVPVTMIAFSHQKNADQKTQRQNRLETQAAFYINGYQKDWYGFNKGALIGSFDGVTWFAIGTGRRITATSTKLFLALNSAFLDLSDKTDTIVNIIPDFTANIAADYDYDPALTLTDPHQNTGATCQRFHQCTTDADCVTQLGWEYACADVTQIKTKWPVFDTTAKESSNQEFTGSLFEILQKTINTTANMRCVYRGQGAPCKVDYSTGITNPSTQKLLTCAPNFYCASVASSKVFNNELVRSPNDLGNILYGMDANVLGRPLNYVTANQTLFAEIISNIQYNGTANTSDTGDMGICRPGRALNSNPLTAHRSADTSKRADYISQVGSCNSSATSSARYSTCPAFDDNLNYPDYTKFNYPSLATATPDAATLTFLTQQNTQNSCGAEAKDTNNNSAFKTIEGLSLFNLQSITQPILAQDACLRRAGSVCHTDLDCGPNSMHAGLVDSLSVNYFGGTTAEQQYWKESLICGQGDPAPVLGSANYLTYQMNANRCCREIGKDFTMYTQGTKTLIPENTDANGTSLVTSKYSYLDPKATGRYSRYTISKTALNDSTTIPAITSATEPTPNQWKTINETGSLTCCGGGWIRKFADGTHNWNVKNNRLSLDTNNFSCLNYRSIFMKPNYNQTNANADLPWGAGATASQAWYSTFQKEYDSFCASPDIYGCMQIPYAPSQNEFDIIGPKNYLPNSNSQIPDDTNWDLTGTYTSKPLSVPQQQTRLNTTPGSSLNSDVPYLPLPFNFAYSRLNTLDYFKDPTSNYGVIVNLPAYMGWDQSVSNPTYIQHVFIKYFYASPKLPVVREITANTGGNCANVFVVNAGTGVAIDSLYNTIGPTFYPPNGGGWCIESNGNTNNRPAIAVQADNNPASPLNGWTSAGLIIDFVPMETHKGTQVATPGNALYYLSKLARLELLGIPQITYEPLYCNSDQTQVLPGIFTSAYKTRNDFETVIATKTPVYSGYAPINSYTADSSSVVNSEIGTYGNASKHFAYQDKIDSSHPAVFSSKDFTCCTPLGKNTTTAANCCSGYAVASTDGKTSICKLPSATDLNVYFNTFVSNEGVGANQPGGGLINQQPTVNPTAPINYTSGFYIDSEPDVDFNPYTGEPKYRASTYDKLVALGNAYCASAKVVIGGAFGAFGPEPYYGYTQPVNGGNVQDFFGQLSSIVDSPIDSSTKNANGPAGQVPFDNGYRWNHHYYCQ